MSGSHSKVIVQPVNNTEDYDRAIKQAERMERFGYCVFVVNVQDAIPHDRADYVDKIMSVFEAASRPEIRIQEAPQTNVTGPHCCHPGCKLGADYELQPESPEDPYDMTHACAYHVGYLMYGGPTRVVPL